MERMQKIQEAEAQQKQGSPAAQPIPQTANASSKGNYFLVFSLSSILDFTWDFLESF